MRKTFLWIGVMVLLMAPLGASSVKVASPNGGESWAPDTAHDITWTSQNPGSIVVNITLRHLNGGLVGRIRTGAALSAGVLHWTVGRLEDGTMAPAASDYIIRIRDAAGAVGDDSDAAFAIGTGSPVIIQVPKYPHLPGPLALQFPKLAVTDIDLTPNADGFGIIFTYKNVGNGPLPKASDMPVKPSYRVLIDGKEMASGNLFIPAFAAPPGWEQWGYFGGWIILPSLQFAGDNWYIGDNITVYINENKVMGMESHSLTLPLKPIALKYKYDLRYTDVRLDWENYIVTVSLSLDGNVPPGRELHVYCGNMAGSSSNFKVKQPAKPGSYTFSGKVKNMDVSTTDIYIYLLIFVTCPDVSHVWDMDFRNNNKWWFRFVGHNPSPVQ